MKTKITAQLRKKLCKINVFAWLKCQIVIALPNNLISKRKIEALWTAFLPSIIMPTWLWKQYLRSLFMTLDLAFSPNAQQTQREETSGLDWSSQRLVTGNTCQKAFKALIWFLQRLPMPVRGYVHINCIYDYITFFGCFIVNLAEKIKSNQI